MSQTVIVFQDENILAASGREGAKPQIQDVFRIELSGYGDPFARWKNGLERLQEKAEELKKVRLVLPASMCQVKSLKLPYAKGKKLDAMVKREMQESIRSEIVDYAVIRSNPKEGVSLVCAGVEKDVLGHFLDMCRELKMEVDSVAAPMEGLQRVLAEKKESRSRTAIFLSFEDEGLTSILMENGQYKYSGRNRLFAEPGTLDFGTEIIRNVSGILQFQMASKSEETVTDLYYAGCQEENFEVSLEGLDALKLEVHPFGELPGVRMPKGEKDSDWLLCVGAMMCGIRGRRNMNLAAFFEKDGDGLSGKKTAVWKQVLPVAVILVLCLAVFAAVQVRNLILEHKISEKDEWIADTLVSETYLQALLSEKHAQQIEQTIREIEQLQKNLATYPKFNKKTISRIEKVDEGFTLKIRSYDSDSGVLTFDAASREVIDIPTYIQKLEGTDLFYQVDYTGYTYQDGVYTLSLLCIMDSPQEGGTE